MQVLQQVWDKALESRLDRKATFVALGGGVVGDMTGFAAAAYQRGAFFIQVQPAPQPVLLVVTSCHAALPTSAFALMTVQGGMILSLARVRRSHVSGADQCWCI